MLEIKAPLIKVYNILLVALAISFSLPDRVAPVLIIILTGLAIVLRVKYKIYFKLNILAFMFFIFFFYYVVRLYGTQNIENGIKFIEKNLAFIVLPIAIIPSLIKNKNNIYKGFILSFSSISFYTMLLVTISSLFFNSDNIWYFQKIEEYGFHPTYMGLYSIISIIVLDRLKLFNNKVNTLLIIINILFIIFSASRVAILVLILIMLYRVIFFRKRVYIYTLVIGSLIVFSAYFISADFQYKVDQLKTFKGFNHYDNNDYGSVSVRVAKIIAARKVWKENYWFGYGTGGLNDELNKKYRSKDIECWPCSQRKYNPHNQYLSVLAGHGLVGFILFSILIGYLVFYASRNKDFKLLEFLIVFLLIGLTESFLERQKGIIIFVFMLYYSFSVKYTYDKKTKQNVIL